MPKEMISLRFEGDKAFVKMNFSSFDIISTCKRKALYSLQRKLIKQEDSPALTFGTAIHAALETWYTKEQKERKASIGACDDTQANMLGNGGWLPHGDCARCTAVESFIKASEPLKHLQNDKRSQENGIAILNNYFDHYLDDPFNTLSDAFGAPFCERKFSLELFDSPQLNLVFFGTVDMILKNEETGAILVVDHKTTSALGNDFYNRVRPNFQFTGYVLGAQKALSLDTNLFMSNGIQVAKTVKGLARQVTQISAEDIEEFTQSMVYIAKQYVECVKSEVWPMTAPNPCTLYGSCAYRNICEVPSKLKENVIQAMYQDKEKRDE